MSDRAVCLLDRFVFGQPAVGEHEAAIAVRDVDERLLRVGGDRRLEPRVVVGGDADGARDDAEVLLRARAVRADAGGEVDAQAVVFRAVVDLGLDVDARDAGIEGDAGGDFAIDAARPSGPAGLP